MKFSKLLFGPAGIPLSTKDRNTPNGIARTKELGLGCMELEFVRNINVSREKAPEIKKKAEKEGIVLTCHAPYYINLNSEEPKTKYGSMSYITKSAEILNLCGGWSVCFHPGYYLKMEPEKVYSTIKERIVEMRKKLDGEGNSVWIRPETTGKPTQFGNYKELLKISQEVERVMPVFDFSHLHARTNGKYNTEAEFRKILEDVEKALGKEGLHNMHIHLSGIEYGEKGEKNHLILEESDMNYKELLKVWKEFDIRGCVISESPNIEEDALLMKKYYESL
ncbi:TPA: TIM barrel protein [Candidatus Woesearchaeota archaeon]|nr:Endonuclease IV [archaeon GW2011_AR15]MBS3103797.1 TIM barrel protein [Candidatus Woesearchaeota archaeon]HIH41458.1 TIM barrel protein [Candidatus Woesearchaeota archaeon]